MKNVLNQTQMLHQRIGLIPPSFSSGALQKWILYRHNVVGPTYMLGQRIVLHFVIGICPFYMTSYPKESIFINKMWEIQMSHVLYCCNMLLFVCFPGVTTLCGCIFHSPVAGFSLLVSRFLDHTQRRATVGRIPLYEWSIRRRDLYLTTHNSHNKHPCLRRDSNPRSQQASGRRPTP